ncbi:hypothetical protein [Trinickia fusca]|uniref:Uncharacterized protein n=1 Tax=Trinickia fusca TaxID=2419777 RepID=A0A494XHM9_9BURK|nr:hypothetical protein [Trinickia fusca]RKP47604.1 hypothetical protein D7S89_15375 [Trinickia fusca]
MKLVYALRNEKFYMTIYAESPAAEVKINYFDGSGVDRGFLSAVRKLSKYSASALEELKDATNVWEDHWMNTEPLHSTLHARADEYFGEGASTVGLPHGHICCGTVEAFLMLCLHFVDSKVFSLEELKVALSAIKPGNEEGDIKRVSLMKRLIGKHLL